jgi:hypothetical protein
VLAIIIIVVYKLAFLKVKPPLYWYHVKIQQADQTLGFFGSSPLDERQFAKQVSGENFLVLNDLVFIDSQMRERETPEDHPTLQKRIYLNPKYIIAFQPLTGDPREHKAVKDQKR